MFVVQWWHTVQSFPFSLALFILALSLSNNDPSGCVGNCTATSKIDIKDFKTDGHDEARALPSVVFWNFANIFLCKKSHLLKDYDYCSLARHMSTITLSQWQKCFAWLDCSIEMVRSYGSAGGLCNMMDCFSSGMNLGRSPRISSPDITCRSCPLRHWRHPCIAGPCFALHVDGLPSSLASDQLCALHRGSWVQVQGGLKVWKL